MYPYFELFGVRLASYGCCLLVAMLVGFFLIWRYAKAHGYVEDTLYCCFFAVLGAAIGAKLLYLATVFGEIVANWAYLWQNPNRFVSLLTQGFVFYGGLLGAGLAIFLYCRKFRIPLSVPGKAILPVIPLLHAIGRIGCFLAGCCYGIAYDGPGSIVFTNSLAAPNGVPLFPVQLLECGCNLVLFALLMVLRKKEVRTRVLGAAYLLGYGILRFGLEFLRGDAERGVFLGISLSQWISLALILGMILWMIKERKANERMQALPKKLRG